MGVQKRNIPLAKFMEAGECLLQSIWVSIYHYINFWINSGWKISHRSNQPYV